MEILNDETKEENYDINKNDLEKMKEIFDDETITNLFDEFLKKEKIEDSVEVFQELSEYFNEKNNLEKMKKGIRIYEKYTTEKKVNLLDKDLLSKINSENQDENIFHIQELFDVILKVIKRFKDSELFNKLLENNKYSNLTKNLICEECEESKASTFCLFCQTFQCSDCLKKLHSVKNRKFHLLIITDLQSFEFKQCPDHEKSIEFICKEKNKIYCPDCLINNDINTNGLININEVISSSEYITHLEEKYIQMLQQEREILTKRDLIEREYQKHKYQIEEYSTKIHKAVDILKLQSKKTLNELHTENADVLERCLSPVLKKYFILLECFKSNKTYEDYNINELKLIKTIMKDNKGKMDFFSFLLDENLTFRTISVGYQVISREKDINTDINSLIKISKKNDIVLLKTLNINFESVKIFDLSTSIEYKKKFKPKFEIFDNNGNLSKNIKMDSIIVDVLAPDNSNEIPLIELKRKGLFKIKFYPQKIGKYILSVKLKDSLKEDHVNGSPFTLYSGESIKLDHKSDFDQNGLFYYLASNAKSENWKSPVDRGLIVLNVSSQDKDSSSINSILSPIPKSDFFTQNNNVNEYIKFSINNGFLKINHLLFKYGDKIVLRNWNLEGFNCLSQKWIIIKQFKNDQSLNSKNLFASWKIDCDDFYNEFRIILTGPNSDGFNYLVLGHMEVYGIFRKH
jgi:hypothetical protein